jgi:hypothetical protein
MDTEGLLCDGELDRARAWGEALATQLAQTRPQQRS